MLRETYIAVNKYQGPFKRFTKIGKITTNSKSLLNLQGVPATIKSTGFLWEESASSSLLMGW